MHVLYTLGPEILTEAAALQLHSIPPSSVFNPMSSAILLYLLSPMQHLKDALVQPSNTLCHPHGQQFRDSVFLPPYAPHKNKNTLLNQCFQPFTSKLGSPAAYTHFALKTHKNKPQDAMVTLNSAVPTAKTQIFQADLTSSGHWNTSPALSCKQIMPHNSFDDGHDVSNQFHIQKWQSKSEHLQEMNSDIRAKPEAKPEHQYPFIVDGSGVKHGYKHGIMEPRYDV